MGKKFSLTFVESTNPSLVPLGYYGFQEKLAEDDSNNFLPRVVVEWDVEGLKAREKWICLISKLHSFF